jgi:phosphoglycerol transferase MdoB-like AlkP superfamily enzyme
MVFGRIIVKPSVKGGQILPIVHALYVYDAIIVVFYPILVIRFRNKTVAGRKPAWRVFPYFVYAVFKLGLYYGIAESILKFDVFVYYLLCRFAPYEI